MWLDYDNDSDLDLVMTNGMVSAESPLEDPFNNDRMRLWNNDGSGTFTEVGISEGIADTASGKGLLRFDYDNDGDLDIFVVNNGGQPVLFRNDSANGNHFLRIETQGTLSNADGIGAWITVTPTIGGPSQTRETNAGSHYLGQSEFIAHFGLGVAMNVDLITIRWPSGLVQSFVNTAADTLLLGIEPVLVGDTDQDGNVDLDDVVVLAENFDGIAGWSGGDFNGTGHVTMTDLDALGSNWLVGATPADPGFDLTFEEAVLVAFPSIPEPSSLMLFVILAGISMIGRRARTPS